ncbi:hypothetical protein A5823_002830 [Enterococcus faecalis]|uniref:hypothetical protein n=1 Tax=Enterococcus faecalis TaxID=1351 RepID=UPI000A33BFDA|nr:hypothetical protein [Enterococcus faecalis]OTP25074.1 hypothetical protein A5823_002830 [Enterococcus faecalis]
MTETKKTRKRKSIEEKLKELEEKEQKLIAEKSKLLELKKEEVKKINTKKKQVLFSAFEKNITNWNQLSIDEVELFCEELFSLYKKEMNDLL